MKKEKLQLFYAKYKLLIYPVCVTLVSILVIVFVIYPQIRGYFTGVEDKKRINERLIKLETKAKELEVIPGDLLNSQVQSSKVALPPEKDYTSIIGLLQRLSAEVGVALVSVTLDTVKGRDTGGVTSFSVKVDVNLPRESFDVFLSKIESSPITMRVASISVDSAQTSDSLLASIIIDVFYAPSPKTFGSIDSPIEKLTAEEEVLVEKLTSNSVSVPVTSSIEESPGSNIPRGKSNPFE